MHDATELAQFLTDHPKKHLIFDFDETLFRLHLPWGEFIDHVRDMLRTKDVAFYTENQDEEWSLWELMNEFVKKHGPDLRRELLAYAQTFEARQSAEPTAYPELIAWITQNAGAYTFSIWSSNTIATIEKTLIAHGLRDLFACLVSHSAVRYTKPDPEGFGIIQSVIEQQYSPTTLSEFLMIGDSAADADGAIAAGIDFYKIKRSW